MVFRAIPRHAGPLGPARWLPAPYFRDLRVRRIRGRSSPDRRTACPRPAGLGQAVAEIAVGTDEEQAARAGAEEVVQAAVGVVHERGRRRGIGYRQGDDMARDPVREARGDQVGDEGEGVVVLGLGGLAAEQEQVVAGPAQEVEQALRLARRGREAHGSGTRSPGFRPEEKASAAIPGAVPPGRSGARSKRGVVLGHDRAGAIAHAQLGEPDGDPMLDELELGERGGEDVAGPPRAGCEGSRPA